MIERPAARYGRQRLSQGARRRIMVSLFAAIIVAGVGIALVGFQRLGTNEVKGDLGAYELVDGHTVQVTISVTRDDPSRPAVCIVRSRAQDGSETGRREVLIPPSPQTTVQVMTHVKSTRTPVVGDVYGCGTDVPAYLVAP